MSRAPVAALKAVQSYSAFYLAIESVPGCEEDYQSSENVPPSIRSAAGGLEGEWQQQCPRVWLLNCLASRYYCRESCAEGKFVYTGTIVLGRKQSSDIVLKDRAISTKHGSLIWKVEILQCPSTKQIVPTSSTAAGPYSFHPNDVLYLYLDFLDQSTNGSYVGDLKLTKSAPHAVHPQLTHSNNDDDGPFLQTDQNLFPCDIISLGKPKLSSIDTGEAPLLGKAGIQRPVFAFGIYVMNTAQLSEPLSPAFISANGRIIETLLHKTLPHPAAHYYFLDLSSELPMTVKSELSAGHGSSAYSRKSGDDVQMLAHPALYPTGTAPGGGPPGGIADGWREKCRSVELLVKDRDNEIGRLTASLQEKMDQINEMRSANEKLKGRVGELEEEQETMSRKEQSRYRELTQKVADLEVELNLTTRKCLGLQTQLNACQVQRDEAVAEKERLGEEMERMELKRRQLTDELVVNRERITELESERASSVSQLAKQRSELSALKRSGDTYRLELKDFEVKYSSLESQFSADKELNRDILDRLRRTEQAYNDTLFHYNGALAEIDVKKKQLYQHQLVINQRQTLSSTFIVDLGDRVKLFERENAMITVDHPLTADSPPSVNNNRRVMSPRSDVKIHTTPDRMHNELPLSVRGSGGTMSTLLHPNFTDNNDDLTIQPGAGASKIGQQPRSEYIALKKQLPVANSNDAEEEDPSVHPTDEEEDEMSEATSEEDQGQSDTQMTTIGVVTNGSSCVKDIGNASSPSSEEDDDGTCSIGEGRLVAYGRIRRKRRLTEKGGSPMESSDIDIDDATAKKVRLDSAVPE